VIRTSRRLVPTALAVTIAAIFAILAASMALQETHRSSGSRSLAEAAPAVARQPQPAATVETAAFDARRVALGLQLVRSGFSSPVLVTSARDGTGRLFVVEQTGRIKVIDGSNVSIFLDLRSLISTGGERGLLGLAFHPNFATHPFVYVNYTDKSGNTQIRRYTASGNVASPSSAFHIVSIGQPYSNHNGGNLAFGPDGYLYIGMGDGGSAGDPQNRAQNINSLLGKMLRIDVDHTSGSVHYRSPSTNPYVGRSGLDQIWQRGLRNPWRWSFDRLTGALWVADVGQARYEEVNRLTRNGNPGPGRGANYGWPAQEGRACYRPSSGCSTSGKVQPVVVYPHATSAADNCAVTGGFVYRGSAYPVLQGGYIYGDFCSGRMWMISATTASPATAVQVWSTSARPAISISSFGEDDAGELYVCDLSGGAVYRITATVRS
jgi:glucose/arabinose dehydrogenase